MKVTNATAGGATVVGDSVFVTLYDNNKEIDTIEALIDESGIAVLEYRIPLHAQDSAVRIVVARLEGYAI